MDASKPHPGRSASFGGFPCLPPSFPPLLFPPPPPGLCRSPARRPRSSLAAPAPSCKGEIAKLVAIMTLHSGRRLPLNVSSPRLAGLISAPLPAARPAPVPPCRSLPQRTKSGEQNPRAFLRPSVEQTATQSPRSEKQWGARGGRQSRRAGVFVRAGDFAFLPHLLFGTPIKSHSFRTFPARSRLSARPGPTMARRSEASPFTRLGTLTIGRVAAQASHRHSPQVTRSRIKPRPPGRKGGRPRGRIRPRRGAAPLGALEAPAAAAEGAAFAPPPAGPGGEVSFSLATFEVGQSLSRGLAQAQTLAQASGKTCGDYRAGDLQRP